MALIIAKFPIEYNPFLIDNALEGPRRRIVQPIFSRRRHQLRRRPPTVSAPRPACASATELEWTKVQTQVAPPDERSCGMIIEGARAVDGDRLTFERKAGRCSGASESTIEGYRGPCAEASSPCGNVVTAIF
jgi:hypothetical protein